MSKKICFALLLVLCLIMLCSCGDGAETLALNVYNWGEYISDGSEDSIDVNAEFEKYYYETYGKKVEVNYTTYASNEDMYNKLKSGGVSYDVIIPSEYMIAKMIDEGMLLKLNFDNIPNYKHIDEEYKGAYYDPKCEYTVPYFCGYVGVIYNSDMVSETPDDWDIMWDEKYAGQILQFNNPRDAFGTAMYSSGIDVNTVDEAEWNIAAEKLKAQKPLVQGYVMDEIFNKMKNGSAAIASYYAGDFISMYADNDALEFYYPKSGTNVFVDAMCIPECAKNKELAEAYINFCLTEEIAVANAEYVCYASPNVLVRDNPEYIECMSEMHEDAIEILYPEGGIKSTYYQNLDADTIDVMNGLWEKLKIENSVEPWVYIFAGAIVALMLALLIFKYINKKISEKYY